MLESDLLVTKFTIPPVRSALLQRSRLLEVLGQSRSCPLTLLSAPTGFGKTTLLSTWAQQGRQTTAVAWVTLDEQDNDSIRFWSYVIAALRKGGASIGETTFAMLHSPQPIDLPVALTTLINELAAQPADVTLILDDYHLIQEQAIHESLQFVLDHLPPCLRLVLASRVDPQLPLARLRAKGQVVEIRETDLRLSSDETAGFLAQVMSLSLTTEDIGRLEMRTEGWIAGLQLAALSLRRHPDASAFIRAFAGSHRLILDYVQGEILEPLPKDRQRFLLHTSVLDQMNAELCQALTGEAGSQVILEELEHANLFLIPLDEERRWYRFHTLFRDVLQARLQATEPEQVEHLHREAALWYQQQERPHEAMPHALATHNNMFVAELLEGCIGQLGLQGELKTLLAWIRQLPQEVLLAHPRLATSYILTFTMMFPFSHQEQEEREYLYALQKEVERLVHSEDQSVFPRQDLEQLRRRLIVLDGWRLAAQALSDGNVEQLSEVGELWQRLPPDEDTMWQLYRLAPFAMAWRAAGNFRPMVTTLREGWKITRMTQNRYLEVQTLWGLIAALIGLGQLSQAHDRCQELQRLVDRLGGPLPVAAYPHFFQAQLAYTWNQLEVAKNEALVSIEKTAPLQYLDVLMGAYEVLVRSVMAQGDLAGAEKAVREMERVNKDANIPLFRPWIESLWVQLWLAQGDLNRAVAWAGRTSYWKSTLFYAYESVYLVLIRVYLAEQRYPQALQRLSELLSSAEQVERGGSVISILALQVAALQASGATQEALPVLLRLLALAEPEGYIRVFLDAGEPMQQALQALLTSTDKDGWHNSSTVPSALASYASTVLAAFVNQPRQVGHEATTVPISRALRPTASVPSASSTKTQQMPEPLTQREQEVLLLLAEGASNQEIARQLVVSLATAKKHVASILSKLDAENRTQAIAHARVRSLL